MWSRRSEAADLRATYCSETCYNSGMSPFENIVDAIHGLSHEEKFKLRRLLDEELKYSPPQNGDTRRHSLIGLLADEPELADQILDSAMIARETRLVCSLRQSAIS